ncbi:MAG: UDP-N-acetylmuramate--L-alanine ligase [Turicibacter sp.]|nr:UDP-N-acetylmuramate--L-alanine ligase [Turicibacter sp.]
MITAKQIHFIGIGGISMSGLAELLHKNGHIVSGSDWAKSDITAYLESIGITVKIGNKPDYITKNIDLVVYTAAVKPDNPEFAQAVKQNIPTINRAELLGLIMQNYQHTVAVAGVHGKTTTTSIVAKILLAADCNPTISIGGLMDMGETTSNLHIGGSKYLVLEACEYFDSFLQLFPQIGIILNIDADHLDYFKTLDGLVDSFVKFAQNIAKKGTLIIHAQNPYLKDITEGLECDVILYDLKRTKGLWARNIRYSKGKPIFSIMHNEEELAEVTLNLYGEHNIENVLAAAAAALSLGLPISKIQKGLSGAVSPKRRFEYKGAVNGVAIIDDYAHHPTEMQASLKTAKQLGYKRIICAFQSHTYSRTANLLEEFARSFENADIVLVLPIYAARETEPGLPNSLAKKLTKQIQALGKEAYFGDFDFAAEWIKKNSKAEDLLITMGAGDVHILGERFLNIKDVLFLGNDF